MTFEELKSLREGEVVVFIKVDEMITDYHEYEVGDELDFMNIFTVYKHVPHFNQFFVPEANGCPGSDVVNFYRKVPGKMGMITHFSYSICDYIERKVKIERDNKLNELGI
jgi:hypothetical protein